MNLKGPTFHPKEESSYLEMEWDGLEPPDKQYGFKKRDLSWDYSDANIPYEGSNLTTTSEMGRNVVASERRKPKGGRQRLIELTLHKPHLGIKPQ